MPEVILNPSHSPKMIRRVLPVRAMGLKIDRSIHGAS